MTRIQEAIVVGGGYAGVIAANRLSTSPDLTVTLVNTRPDFVERIRLHQHATGDYRATVPFREVLAKGIRLRVDTAERIDAESGELVLGSGHSLPYDHLVYAVGSHAAAPDVPGAAEHALALSTLEQAERLRPALAALAPDSPVIVVGGGATGIEVTGELAEQGRPVTLLAGGGIGSSLHPRTQRAVVRRLERLGARVLTGPEARAREVRADRVLLADGRELPSALTVWTAGFAVPDLATRSGLATDPLGRLLTDETMTSIDDERIVAAGDCAAPSGTPYRMCCAVAQPLGALAAGTVLHRVAGTAPRARSVPLPGQCLSLGRRAGVMQLARRDDSPLPIRVGGAAGGRLKESIAAGTLVGLRTLARRPGLIAGLTLVQDPHRTADPAKVQESSPQRDRTAHPVGGPSSLAD